MRKRIAAVSFLTLVALCSCGPIIVDPRTDGGNLYSYSFNEFGCVTDRHTFSTKGEMCEGLKSRDLNNDCASLSRARYFDSSGCPGTFSDR